MATMTKPLKLTPIFFFFFSLSLLLIIHTTSSQQFSDQDIDGDDEVQEYVLDAPVRNLGESSTRSMFLKKVIKKGTHCNAKHNVCNGVYANNGTSLLYCCKTHCRNIRGDRNNCGKCGKKCSLGELCCNSVCTSIAYNASHCGKCNKKCAKGLSCDYGTCGYA